MIMAEVNEACINILPLLDGDIRDIIGNEKMMGNDMQTATEVPETNPGHCGSCLAP